MSDFSFGGYISTTHKPQTVKTYINIYKKASTDMARQVYL